MNRLSPENNNISTRGKTIKTLIKELVSFSNPDIIVKTLWEEEESKNLPPRHIAEVIAENDYCLLINDEEENAHITIRQLLQYFLGFQNFDTEVKFSIDNRKNVIGIGLVGKRDGDCVLFSSE